MADSTRGVIPHVLSAQRTKVIVLQLPILLLRRATKCSQTTQFVDCHHIHFGDCQSEANKLVVTICYIFIDDLNIMLLPSDNYLKVCSFCVPAIIEQFYMFAYD